MMAAYAEMEEKYNTSHIKHRRGRKVATVNEVSENTLKNQAEKDGWKHTPNLKNIEARSGMIFIKGKYSHLNQLYSICVNTGFKGFS